MEPTATTTPAPVPTNNQEPPTDPRRITSDPSMQRIDERISGLKPFHFPAKIDAEFFDTSVAQTANAHKLTLDSLKMIDKETQAAHDRVMKDFRESTNLSLLDQKNLDRVTADAEQRATKAARDERTKQEEIFKGVLGIHDETLELLENQLTGLLTIMPNSASMLDVSAPATDTRERYASMLSKASYASLTTWAAMALFQPGNRDLAAAVGNELSVRGKDARPLAPNDFAERIIGDAHKKLRIAQAEVVNARSNIRDAKIASMRQRQTLVSKLSRALRENEIDKLKGKA